ncbi:Hypothetical metal-binding enzyme, YcbL homolog [invertebrate metagenome]|uniref:Hypothetical metal-binding enzyme, YcbL homolog n=1 Tax=invertebrate metagenome TaxID=1711999 RepID=A0A484H798_9ZZZZ
MYYAVVPVTPFQQNCTLLWCPDTRKGVVVDPGGDVERIGSEVAKYGIAVERILLTHGHIDHAGGAGKLAANLGVPIEGPHQADSYWIRQMAEQGRYFGVQAPASFTPHRWLEAGDTIRLGHVTLDVLHCPGHTPGHVVFYENQSRIAQVGDVLFAGSIGRTDFPGGDYGTLIQSIKNTLLPLGDDVTFIPGHGPLSTFGAERLDNPFLQA